MAVFIFIPATCLSITYIILTSMFSSYVNEVNRAISSLYIFFIYFFFTKRFHTHKKAKNAYKRTKTKKAAFYVLKKHLREKSLLFAYLRFCAFVLLLGCVFVLSVLFVRAKYFSKKKIKKV